MVLSGYTVLGPEPEPEPEPQPQPQPEPEPQPQPQPQLEPEPEPEPELEPEPKSAPVPEASRRNGGTETEEAAAVVQLSGYMEKKGEHFGASFKRRFFTLDVDSGDLVYSEIPGSSPKGCISMAAKPAVRFSQHPNATSGEIEVVTDTRTYRLRCATASDARRWIAGLTTLPAVSGTEAVLEKKSQTVAPEHDKAGADAMAEARQNATARLKVLETRLFGSTD
eukprot:COSAG02_NODE_4028_length_5886_cov_2.738552_1_plen_222_part_10